VDTDRAFVFPREVKWIACKDIKTDAVAYWEIAVIWENGGKTPTRHLRVFINLHLDPNVLPDEFEFPDVGTETIPTLIPPGGGTIESSKLAITLANLEKIRDGKAHLYTWGWAEYDDVFERTQRHRTEFCYKWSVGGDPRYPDKFSTRWETHHQYNGADDECEGPLRTMSPKDMGR
jgi:hypothetical protein